MKKVGMMVEEYEEQVKNADALRKQEKETFALAFEDMTKAVSSLERAIDTLKASESVSMMTVPEFIYNDLLCLDEDGIYFQLFEYGDVDLNTLRDRTCFLSTIQYITGWIE